MCSWNWRSWSPGRWVCLNRETKMNSSSLYLYIYIYTHTSSLLTIIVFSSVSPCPWVFLILGKPNHHWWEISPLKLPTESVEKHHAWHCCRVSGSCYRHIPSSNNTFPLNKYKFSMNMLLFLFHAKVGKFSKLAHLVVSGSTCFFLCQEHQQSAFDAKLMELDAYVKCSTRRRLRPTWWVHARWAIKGHPWSILTPHLIKEKRYPLDGPETASFSQLFFLQGSDSCI